MVTTPVLPHRCRLPGVALQILHKGPEVADGAGTGIGVFIAKGFRPGRTRDEWETDFCHVAPCRVVAACRGIRRSP
jgi:hypothetical protein